ncbi:MAG: sugar phosphate isomerase/epimerase family protein [Verrucomicrobiia bacterium]
MTASISRRQFMTTCAAAAALGDNPVFGAENKNTPRASTSGRQNSFSVSLNCFTWGRFDLAQCIDQIKKTPIRQLEVPVEQARPKSLVPELMVDAPLGGDWRYSFPDLQSLIARDGFSVESVDLFGYTGYPGAENIIKRRIDFAQRLGARTLVMGCHHKALSHAAGASTASATKVENDARDFIYSMLRDVAAYGAQRNVRIALEIHGGIMANAAEALRTMKEVGHSNLGINFDTANILFYNEAFNADDAARELRALARHVFHVHLKDIIRGKTKATHTLPRLGRGEVDFKRVFTILHEAGFFGPFSFEVETFHGVTKSDDIGDYLNDLLASIDYVRSLGELS